MFEVIQKIIGDFGYWNIINVQFIPFNEKDQTKWHAPGKFDKITGEIQKKPVEKPSAPKYQEVFGHTIVELA